MGKCTSSASLFILLASSVLLTSAQAAAKQEQVAASEAEHDAGVEDAGSEAEHDAGDEDAIWADTEQETKLMADSGGDGLKATCSGCHCYCNTDPPTAAADNDDCCYAELMTKGVECCANQVGNAASNAANNAAKAANNLIKGRRRLLHDDHGNSRPDDLISLLGDSERAKVGWDCG